MKSLLLKAKEAALVLRAGLVEDRDPDSFARGLGIGLFIAFLPLPAFQSLLALGVAHFLGANRAVAVGASLITNWLTFAPVFVGAVWVGSALLPGVPLEVIIPADWSWASFRGISKDLLLAYVTGSLFFSLVTGILGYCLAKSYAESRAKARCQKIEGAGYDR